MSPCGCYVSSYTVLVWWRVWWCVKVGLVVVVVVVVRLVEVRWVVQGFCCH